MLNGMEMYGAGRAICAACGIKRMVIGGGVAAVVSGVTVDIAIRTSANSREARFMGVTVE
jgi:hypothetical protein